MNQKYAQFLLDKVKEDYNKIAEDYSRTRQNVWQEILFLFDYIKPGDKILDLGCGSGRYLPTIKARGGVYFGVDNSGEMVRIGKKKYSAENIQLADALCLPFGDGFFDAVYSLAVLHHIPSGELRKNFLREAKRVVKPGGFIILTVWRPKDKIEKQIFLKFFLKKIFGFSKLDFGDVIELWFGKAKGERYYHCFAKKELMNLIKEVGLQVEKIGEVGVGVGNRNNIYAVARKI